MTLGPPIEKFKMNFEKWKVWIVWCHWNPNLIELQHQVWHHQNLFKNLAKRWTTRWIFYQQWYLIHIHSTCPILISNTPPTTPIPLFPLSKKRANHQSLHMTPKVNEMIFLCRRKLKFWLGFRDWGPVVGLRKFESYKSKNARRGLKGTRLIFEFPFCHRVRVSRTPQRTDQDRTRTNTCVPLPGEMSQHLIPTGNSGTISVLPVGFSRQERSVQNTDKAVYLD